MLLHLAVLVAPIALLAIPALALDTIANASQITLTAIITTEKNISALQCWTLETPFIEGPAPFLALNLGEFENVTYRVFPPHSSTGVHNAPRHQMILVQSGIVQIALPKDDGSYSGSAVNGTGDVGIDTADAVYSSAGQGGVFLALDITGRGHRTSQVSDDEGLVLELPFAGGVIPGHTVVNSTGPCRGDESFL